MSHSNRFQPWKSHPPNFFNTTSGNYMHSIPQSLPIQNYSTFHGLDQVSTSTPSIPATTNFNNSSNNSSSSGSSSNKGGPNYHKINSIDKMVGLDSLVDEKIDNSTSGGACNRDERNNKLRQFAEKNISDGQKQQILHVLDKIGQLSPMEKLLLYLRLPGGYPETDPLRQSQNPLGQRSEINHTINWVKSHLEHDDNVSIPKQDVYDDYVSYCGRVNIKPLSTADFGKVMKQVFPNIRPRRLGTRGNSRYCYAAMRKATKLDCPMLPEIGSSTSNDEGGFDFQTHENSWRTVKSWAEGLLSMEFDSLEQLAEHINKQHLNSPASISSRQLLQKKLLQKELKEKKKLNESSLKKRRKKRKKLSSQSDSLQNYDDENSNNKNPDAECTNTSSKSPDTRLDGQESSTNCEATRGTNESCDERATDNSDNGPKESRRSPDSGCNNKKVKENRFVQPQTSSTIIKRASNLVSQMDKEDEEEDDDEEIGENKELQQQQQGNRGLKKIRLTPRTDFGSISTTTTTTNSLQQQANVTDATNDQTNGQVTDIPIPLSRERMISLCTINKDELGCYLPDFCNDNDPEENSQDQEVELMQIFQAEGKTQQQMNNNTNHFNNNHNLHNNNHNPNGKTHNSSIPVLENYQLQLQGNNNTNSHNTIMRQMSQQNKISELRSLLEQNLQQQQQQQSMSGPNGSGFCAADTLTMLSQRHDPRYAPQTYSIIQRKLPNFQSGTRKNTFVPIPNTGGHRPIDTSPFVSPRATPIAKSKRSHNLPPLQMINTLVSPKPVPVMGTQNTAFTRPHHFKQELPASAPTSPSLRGTFRYYSGQPENTASTIYHHSAENRSQSVPLHQQPQDDYSAYSSTCNSVNPTPVPSEFHDFDEQQNNLLEMFSSESGVVPNIKMENDLMPSDFLDTDEVSSTIDMQQILPDSSKSCLALMSRSVPSTPLPCNYNNNNNLLKETNITCANNNLLNGINSSKYPQSVPTTPVPPGSTSFRYTPPATRDYLINGYNNQLEQKLSEKAEQTQALVANSSFMTSNEQNIEQTLDNFPASSTNNSDSIIEGDIFNEMT